MTSKTPISLILFITISLNIISTISSSIADDPTYIESLSELHKLNTKSRKPVNRKPCDKWSEFQCVSELHGIECIPNEYRCDGLYHCRDQSDERHCKLNYQTKDFSAKCSNKHGSYAPYALSDIFSPMLGSGEISIAVKDYFQCNIQLKNVTNLDMIKFTFEGVASYAQMVSENIKVKLFYLQAGSWIHINSTYYDHDSTQLTTTFITKKNERGIYTNNVKFRIYNIPPKQNKHYSFVKNEYLHITDIKLFGNYMPFYCPTNLVTKYSMFQKQIAEWKYIPTYKLCNSVPDCIDGSDEIFCDHNGLIQKNKQSMSLGKLLTKHKTGGNVGNSDNASLSNLSLIVIMFHIINIVCNI